MTRPLVLLSMVAALVAGPVWAQESTTEAPAEEAAQAAEGAAAVPAVGDSYERTEGDWTLICEKTLSGDDPCRMAQLLRDNNDNPVIEAELSRLQGENLPSAVMVFNTPLLTVLPEGVTLSIDGGSPVKIPFLFCDRSACIARVNLRDPDVNTFKRGANATVRIVPLAAPDNSVTLTMSLTGFTAAYDSINPVNPPQ
ncbi:MAG: invasion associated locus B family protein [Paracoccaceae bacterium]|nr:invasion associated locus B family protein [Paracoccaceae bacterium]